MCELSLSWCAENHGCESGAKTLPPGWTGDRVEPAPQSHWCAEIAIDSILGRELPVGVISFLHGDRCFSGDLPRSHARLAAYFQSLMLTLCIASGHIRSTVPWPSISPFRTISKKSGDAACCQTPSTARSKGSVTSE